MAEKLTVRAVTGGHYGDRHRRKGDVFDLVDRAGFAGAWMAAVGWDPKAPVAATTEAAPVAAKEAGGTTPPEPTTAPAQPQPKAPAPKAPVAAK